MLIFLPMSCQRLVSGPLNLFRKIVGGREDRYLLFAALAACARDVRAINSSESVSRYLHKYVERLSVQSGPDKYSEKGLTENAPNRYCLFGTYAVSLGMQPQLSPNNNF